MNRINNTFKFRGAAASQSPQITPSSSCDSLPSAYNFDNQNNNSNDLTMSPPIGKLEYCNILKCFRDYDSFYNSQSN
eukprot:Pgem_evm1s5809